MAKRMTFPGRRRWPQALGTAWLALLAILVGVGAQIVRAGEPVQPDANPLPGSPASTLIVAPLEYQETAYTLNNVGASLTTQSSAFKREPAGDSGRVYRGSLNFGEGASNAIPFLWQRGAGKLYLDLNRNQDLTDDPAGVFPARLISPHNYSYQTFTNVLLSLTTSLGSCPVLADLSFWDYGARPVCSVALRSFWRGKLTASGRDWQVGVIPTIWVGKDGRRELTLEHGHLLLRGWEKRDQPFNAFNGSLDIVPFSPKLFFGGHAYQLSWLAGPPGSGEPGPNPGSAGRPALRASLQLVEQSVPLGALKITGKYIQRLTLPGDAYFTILDQPAGVVQVPAGSYRQPNVFLEQNGTQAWCNLSSWPALAQVLVRVNGQTPATLDVGGPLTNSVSATRHGADLRLDYRLVGAGGQVYQLANVNRAQPPEFAVYRGGSKIASGSFEFG